jgi:bifunctional non-homologous end joining protein LigD
VDAALKKGDLKFTLDGYKLKGSWVLVRTSGRYAGGGGSDGARSWLLIKHKDEWAGDVDIVEFAPKSVTSGGDFAEILADGQPEIWISNRPAQGGETGAMFQKIVERALEMKGSDKTVSRPGAPAKIAKTTKTTKPVKKGNVATTSTAKKTAPKRRTK